jgi:hypothetical protein
MLRWSRLLVLVLLVGSESCGTSTPRTTATSSTSVSTASRQASPSASSRQQATVCTKQDATRSLGPLPLPPYRRLTQPVTTWFGRVHLAPPLGTAQPTIPLAQAWDGLGFVDERYSSAIYDVVLADWTSDDNFVIQTDGQPVPHRHVLAWVALGRHRPVDASDVSADLTVAGVPCYFGTSITAVDATTGQAIADALDYHR